MSWADETRHFSPSGDPGLNDPMGDRMDPDLMRLLDAFREETGLPFVVTAGYRFPQQQDALLQAGLTETSAGAHPLGKAVDGYLVGLPPSLQFTYACRWPFSGIGLYPYTSTDQPVIHLDMLERGQPRTALWIRNRSGRYVYAPSREFAYEWRLLLTEEGELWSRILGSG